MGFIAGLKAGFTLYGLGFTVGAGLISAAISMTFTVLFGLAAVVMFRR